MKLNSCEEQNMPCEVPEGSGNSTSLLFKFDSQTVTTAKGCKTC